MLTISCEVCSSAFRSSSGYTWEKQAAFWVWPTGLLFIAILGNEFKCTYVLQALYQYPFRSGKGFDTAILHRNGFWCVLVLEIPSTWASSHRLDFNISVLILRSGETKYSRRIKMHLGILKPFHTYSVWLLYCKRNVFAVAGCKPGSCCCYCCVFSGCYKIARGDQSSGVV